MIRKNTSSKRDKPSTGTSDPPSVAELVQSATRGDRSAFGTLYERYARYVKTIANRVLRNEADAEEVCQDVFIQAMKKLNQLKNPACFGGWIGSIAHRRSLNHKARKRIVLAGDSPLLECSTDKELLPAERVLATEEAAYVQENVQRLRPLDRNTLIAFYFQGQTLLEMSEKFDAPVGTIKRRLHVARKRLARQFETGVAV